MHLCMDHLYGWQWESIWAAMICEMHLSTIDYLYSESQMIFHRWSRWDDPSYIIQNNKKSMLSSNHMHASKIKEIKRILKIIHNHLIILFFIFIFKPTVLVSLVGYIRVAQKAEMERLEMNNKNIFVLNDLFLFNYVLFNWELTN